MWIMTDFENGNDGQGSSEFELHEAAITSVEQKVCDIIRASKCVGCPFLLFPQEEAKQIDQIRSLAASQELFSVVESAIEEMPDLEGPSNIGIILPSGLIGHEIDEDTSPSEGTGKILNSLLDAQDVREESLLDRLRKDVDECPGALDIKGHDAETRQIYDVRVCSNPRVQEISPNGTVPCFANLTPDV